MSSRSRAPARRAALVLALLSLIPAAACAHERFVRHALVHPLQCAYFGRHPGAFLGVEPDMMRIGAHAALALFGALLLWFVRQPIEEMLQNHILVHLGNAVHRAGHQMACFFTDRPVKNRPFHSIGEWAVIMFLRSPGLVLMYSATHDSLVMPSYPLDPRSATFFKFAQVGLAILILTQTLLPLCGALLFGTWLYLTRWGWMVAINALPVLSVAVVYASSPWQSHKLAITEINARQLRWVRLTLGFGFMALGWLKIYNHNLVAGVADQYPAIMNDPIVKLLAAGTAGAFRRESWVVSFGLAEVLSGFLLMMGVFTRAIGLLMAFVFTKLMLVDFGWDEIPHIYPIGALLVLIFSSKLKSELDPVEAVEERLGRNGRNLAQAAAITLPALAVALLVVFPLLTLFTFFDRSQLY